ncbi:hypothetical protein PARMER_01138 [Parabacteroides merdae ATCC 43184]|nr:hypothetical protein PARMER_01138 [Parabacteroides merdae ATCC 43184]
MFACIVSSLYICVRTLAWRCRSLHFIDYKKRLKDIIRILKLRHFQTRG